MQILDLPIWEVAAGHVSQKFIINHSRDIKFE